MSSSQEADGATSTSVHKQIGLHVTLLGTFTVRLGPQEIPPTAFPRRKALQLFKLIALQPAYQLHRDQVLELLWSHLSVDSANAQLYKAVHYVRQALATADPPHPPDTLFELRDEIIGLAVPDGVHTDVEAFERLAQEAVRADDLSLLQQAAACYTGHLLPADRYEEWTLARRDSLRDLFVDVLVKLGQRYQARHFLAEAVDVFRQALIQDGLREDAHRGLMQVYAIQGSRSRALRQYQRCSDVLAEELGVEPSIGTTQLYADILQDQIQPVPLLRPQSVMEVPLRPSLIGRDTERQVLEQCLIALDQGQGGVLAIEGLAGIGKTRLAQEIVQMADKDWTVLWGSTHEQEGQRPYTPFIEVLHKALRIDPSDAKLIPAELAAAIPVLPPDVTPVKTADRLAAQSALFAGVLRFLVARAERSPIVLILDDLHAADTGTLKLFAYLARQTTTANLLLVGIWRVDESPTRPSQTQILDRLERNGLVHRLRLKPLSKEAHHRLLEQALEGDRVAPMLAGQLYESSFGNPLFATEMILQLLDSKKISLGEDGWQLADDDPQSDVAGDVFMSPSLQGLVNQRLAPMTPAALRMLQFASVAGRDVPVVLLEAWAQLGEHGVLASALLDVLDDAVQAGLLREQGFSYLFAHPLFREAIYHQMSTARQRALHRQVASGLKHAYQENPDMLPVEAVAYHYLQAGDVDHAVSYLVEAGDRAAVVYDHDSALQRYREALALLEPQHAGNHQRRAEVYERIGDVHRAVGKVVDSLSAYRQVFEILASDDTMAEPAARYVLHRKTSHTAVLTPDMPTAAEHLDQARALLTGDALKKAQVLISQALYDWHANELESAVENATRALAIAEKQGAALETSQACEMLAMSHLPLGHWEEGLQYELRRQTPDWSPEIVLAVDAHLCLYQFRLQGTEPYQKVKTFIDRVRQQSSNIGALRCLAICHYVLGSLAVLQARPNIAFEHLAEALTLHQRIGSPSSAAYTLARQTDLLTAIGDANGGWACVQQGLAMAEQAAVRDHSIMMVHAAGIWNRLADSDLTSAADLVQAAEQHDAEVDPCVVCSVDRYTALAAYYLAVDDPDTADQYVAQALQLTDSSHNDLGRARVLRVQAQTHLARDRLPEAETCLSEAAEIFCDLDDKFDLAQTLRIYEDFPPTGHVSPDELEFRLRSAQQMLDLFRMNTIQDGIDFDNKLT